MIWTIKLPIVTPSGNQTLRQHWSRRSRHREDIYWLLTAALNQQDPIPAAAGRRRLTIERHGKKSLDADNLAAGCKTLIDVVKSRKLIRDDNPTNCELVFRQVVNRILAPYTLLILEDCA